MSRDGLKLNYCLTEVMLISSCRRCEESVISLGLLNYTEELLLQTNIVCSVMFTDLRLCWECLESTMVRAVTLRMAPRLWRSWISWSISLWIAGRITVTCYILGNLSKRSAACSWFRIQQSDCCRGKLTEMSLTAHSCYLISAAW